MMDTDLTEDDEPPFAHIKFTDTQGEHGEIRIMVCCANPTPDILTIYNATTDEVDSTIGCSACSEHWLWLEVVPWVRTVNAREQRS